MTQMRLAREGHISEAMERVAVREGLEAETIRAEVARGRMVIPANVHHERLDPMAIGLAARVKINANIGSSPTTSGVEEEVEKLALAQRWGADTVMDLSTGKRIDETREAILAAATVPIGTVPIYQALERVDRIEDLSAEVLLETIEHQARQGVDYMTIHAGVLLAHLPLCRRRVTGIVSPRRRHPRRWMVEHERENPLYEAFDEVLRDLRRARRDDLARRRPAARLDRRRLRRGPVRRAADARQADRAGLGARRPGDGRGAGPRAARPARANVKKQQRALPRSALLHARPAGHRHRARL